MDLGKIIRQRREQLGLTQDQVAEHAGISKPYLSNIETGKAKNPPTDGILESLEQTLQFESLDLVRLANLARTPKDILREHETMKAELDKFRSILRDLQAAPRDGQGRLNIQAVAEELMAESKADKFSAGEMIPVINKMSAGYPQNFTDLDYPAGIADEYIRCPDINDPQAFAARVSGDSMEPKYHPGDIVVFSPNTQARSGSDCFVRFGPEEGTTFKRYYQDNEATVRLQPLNNAYPAQIYATKEVTGLWPAVMRIERLNNA